MIFSNLCYRIFFFLTKNRYFRQKYFKQVILNFNEVTRKYGGWTCWTSNSFIFFDFREDFSSILAEFLSVNPPDVQFRVK